MADVPITELTYLEADEVHFAGKAANGFVELVAKSLADEIEWAKDDLSGNPISPIEAMKALNADTSISDVEAVNKTTAYYEMFIKATFTQAERDKAAAAGEAMSDGSYPIQNGGQLDDAIHAVGRGNGSHDAIRAHIIKRAKALGMSDKIPDNWKADGSMASKAAECKTCGGTGKINEGHKDCPDCDGASKAVGICDTCGEPLEGHASVCAEKDMTDVVDTSGGMPGSPAWEAEDAERAVAIGQGILAIGQMISDSRDREATEVQYGQADDASEVMSLDQALDAVDFILSVIAPFAFREEAEGTLAAKSGKRLSDKTVNHLVAGRKAITDLLGDDDPEKGGESATKSTKEADVDEAAVKALIEESSEQTVKSVLDALDARDAQKAEAAKAEADEKASRIQTAIDAAKAAGVPDEQIEAMSKALSETPTDTASKSVEGGEAIKALVVESIGEAVKAAISPLESRLANIEGQPERGGPIASAGTDSSKQVAEALKGLAPRGAVAEADPALKALDDEIEAVKGLADQGDPVAREKLEMYSKRRSIAMLTAVEKARMGQPQNA